MAISPRPFARLAVSCRPRIFADFENLFNRNPRATIGRDATITKAYPPIGARDALELPENSTSSSTGPAAHVRRTDWHVVRNGCFPRSVLWDCG